MNELHLKRLKISLRARMMSRICRRNTATIQLIGSYKAYLEGVAVARNIPAADMALGRKLAVNFFDEHNPKEAIIVAVYT